MIQLVDVRYKPISLIGKCAGECWGADTSDPQKNYDRGYECLENNHGRTIEFPDVIIRIGGYSARVIREIYTHIIGTTRLQESTRYIKYGDFTYFTPPSIAAHPRALLVYENIMNYISNGYKELEDLGIPKEDIANVLPLGMDSTIVLKINLRAIMHMFEERECSRAYHEFRAFMRELRKVLSSIDEEYKTFCDEFCMVKCKLHGYCRERYTCGLYPKRLKDGSLLYSKKNAFRCPMYNNINGCIYEDHHGEVCCNRCALKHAEIAEQAKNKKKK